MLHSQYSFIEIKSKPPFRCPTSRQWLVGSLSKIGTLASCSSLLLCIPYPLPSFEDIVLSQTWDKPVLDTNRQHTSDKNNDWSSICTSRLSISSLDLVSYVLHWKTLWRERISNWKDFIHDRKDGGSHRQTMGKEQRERFSKGEKDSTTDQRHNTYD